MPKLKEEPTMWIAPVAIEMEAKNLYGDNWRRTLPAEFDISYSQLHRYMTVYNGQTAPKVFAMALTALAVMDDATRKRFDAMMAGFKDSVNREPVKFVAVKAEKPAKPPRIDAPEAGFSFDDEPAAPAAPETAKVLEAVQDAKATIAKAKKPKATKPAATPEPPAPAETKAQRDARKKREKRAAEKAAREAAAAKPAKTKKKEPA